MKKYLFLLSALVLTGCVMQPQPLTELNVPLKVKYNQKTYQLAKSTDLGSMARYFYIDRKSNLENWKSAVELLLDRNENTLNLQDRIALRKKVFQQNQNEFDMYIKDDFLYGFVIYQPTTQNKEWQVDIYKGREVENCGFVQYQFSVKVERKKKIVKMDKQKLRNYLKKYVVNKELKYLQNTDWHWGCKVINAK